MDGQELKRVIEGALFAADGPLSLDQLMGLFEGEEPPARETLREALAELATDYEGRGVELQEVGSGFRFQVREAYATWIGRLWEERPPKYSRALLETLALIAYRQPITRAEIEEIRGVTVSTNIVRTLQEREWIKVVGHRDVPGKPAMYGTTRQFLDYFNLKSLSELPTLAELRDIDKINEELDLHVPGETVPAEVEEASPEAESAAAPMAAQGSAEGAGGEGEETAVEATGPAGEAAAGDTDPDAGAEADDEASAKA